MFSALAMRFPFIGGERLVTASGSFVPGDLDGNRWRLHDDNRLDKDTDFCHGKLTFLS
jgi:hypothetical protein